MPSRLAYLPADAGVVTVDLDATKAEAVHRPFYKLADLASIAFGVHEGEAEETIRVPGHNSPDLLVGRGVVGMERGEEDRLPDTSAGGAAQVRPERGGGVPRAAEPVAAAGVTVRVDDRHVHPTPGGRSGHQQSRRDSPRAAPARS